MYVLFILIVIDSGFFVRIAYRIAARPARAYISVSLRYIGGRPRSGLTCSAVIDSWQPFMNVMGCPHCCRSA
jgi:hypothetical protein